jgi:methionyl-tRNA formyltransferase
MKSVFIGAVHGSRIALEALIKSGHPPALVVTLPAEFAHRHSDFSDIADVARKAGCSIHFSQNINATDTLDVLRMLAPDLCMTIGWSQICKPEFLSVAKLGNIGFHPAPLPRFRGRAVIPWTILRGEAETASTLFWLDEGTDSGDLLMQRSVSVDDGETARTLYDKHTRNLSEMLPEALATINAGAAARIPQDHGMATYCAKRTPEDGLVDWHEPATAVERLIRAVGEPYPGAFAYCEAEKLTLNAGRISLLGDRFIGIPGQVQSHTHDGFLVMCGNATLLEVTDWTLNSIAKPRIHTKLSSVKK